jgi:hypothetical protein
VPGNHVKFTLALVLAALAFGQAPADSAQERILNFSRVTTPQSLQETINAIRGITDIREITIDNAQRSLMVHGTADQLALAAWLSETLDVAENGQPPTGRTLHYDYAAAAKGDTAVRVIWLVNIKPMADLQELVTAVRGLADLGRIFPRSAPAGVVFRGTPGQAAFAEWLIGELDSSTAKAYADRKPVAHTYPEGYLGTTAARVYYLPPATPQALQASANMVRGAAKIRVIWAFDPASAVVLRATPEAAEAADGLLGQAPGH